MYTPSPLRYPGGKSSILAMMAKIVQENNLQRGHYVEPYAGGCGLALGLMFNGHVHQLHLNDIDPSIFGFWDSILNHKEEFVKRIRKTPVTLKEWRRQRDVWLNKSNDSFDLGFAAFFLNRTNRSGIICRAGIIGGIDQSGKYKIDCRFNKDGLIDKIERIHKYRHRISFHNLDALEFLKKTSESLPENSFYCIDPPYYEKGAALYTNFYNHEDHKALADHILNLNRPWVLTYDNHKEIQKLYRRRRMYSFNVSYMAATKRVGNELLIAGKWVKIPKELGLSKVA